MAGDDTPAAPVPAEPAPGDAQAPLLRRAKKAGATKAAFRAGGWGRWVTAALALLTATILLPFLAPQWAGLSERAATLAALAFLLAAPGLAMGMRSRAIAVATVVVLLLYGLSASGAVALHLEDLFLVTVLVSFGLFVLAGFNLVLILEEMVYDIHRLVLHPRNHLWFALPFILFALLALGLPMWAARGGPGLPIVYGAAVACTVVVGLWWMLRAALRIREEAVTREVHLLAFSVLAASLLAEGIRYLQEAEELIPSVVAYLILIGTWIYVNYTTLQRAHFLLRARDPGPWIAILLSASFAIVAHAQSLFQKAGTAAVQDLTGVRVGYMVGGVAAGVLFLVVRGAWRGVNALAQEVRLSEASRRAAERAGRVAGTLLATENKVEEATLLVFKAIDRVLPGTQQPPQRHPRPWELDGEGIGPRP